MSFFGEKKGEHVAVENKSSYTLRVVTCTGEENNDRSEVIVPPGSKKYISMPVAAARSQMFVKVDIFAVDNAKSKRLVPLGKSFQGQGRRAFNEDFERVSEEHRVLY